jgi:hypothetical protein
VDFSRRQVITAAGSVVLLAACGDNGETSGSDTSGGTSGGDPIDAPEGGWILVQRFPTEPLMVPGEVRLPVSLADDTRMLDNGPATLAGWVETDDDARTRIADVTGIRRHTGISTPYWEMRATIPEAGSYALRVEGDDGFGASFTVFSPADVISPMTGDELPPFETPTVDDHRGVDPYCSLTPDPCPFHEVTLTEALALGKPLAYMVGTPAHCQTGTCAPGLQFLMAEQARVGDKIVVVHADVYADNAATTVAPAVDALGVQYEPIIYFCTADGTIVDRLDAIWDASELTERIDALLAR